MFRINDLRRFYDGNDGGLPILALPLQLYYTFSNLLHICSIFPLEQYKVDRHYHHRKDVSRWYETKIGMTVGTVMGSA